MPRSYPKHKYALEVNVRGITLAKLYNEGWVAQKFFDMIKIDDSVLQVTLWHDNRIIKKRSIRVDV